jgi:hypothetical protein
MKDDFIPQPYDVCTFSASMQSTFVQNNAMLSIQTEHNPHNMPNAQTDRSIVISCFPHVVPTLFIPAPSS